jgi:recombinational DNA repair protein RecT
MTAGEVHDIREKSDAYKAYKNQKTKTCIWVDNEGEMFRKTVLRRIFKHLPKSNNSDRVANAFSLWDNDFKATDNQRTYIENLLHNSRALPDKKAQMIESRISDPDLSAEEAGVLIGELQDAQPDPVTESGNYTQTQLLDHMGKLK